MESAAGTEVPARGSVLELVRHCLTRLRAPARKLRLCESLSLGERRAVVVLEFEGARYLVGATPASITLLSRLADADQDGIGGFSQEGKPCEP